MYQEVRKIGKTIPVYFTDEELELLKRIDKARKHISRAGWMKQAAEEKLKKEEEK